jgi:hypothetical protein
MDRYLVRIKIEFLASSVSSWLTFLSSGTTVENGCQVFLRSDLYFLLKLPNVFLVFKVQLLYKDIECLMSILIIYMYTILYIWLHIQIYIYVYLYIYYGLPFKFFILFLISDFWKRRGFILSSLTYSLNSSYILWYSIFLVFII